MVDRVVPVLPTRNKVETIDPYEISCLRMALADRGQHDRVARETNHILYACVSGQRAHMCLGIWKTQMGLGFELGQYSL